MHQPNDIEAELLRAEATMVVMRGLVPKGTDIRDRYRFHPSLQTVDRAEARMLLARQRKPLVCTAAADSSALVVDCRSIEDSLSISSERLKNFGALREMIEQEIRQRLEQLSPLAADDWIVTIVAGDDHTNLDFANYLSWMSEYSFRGCVVTEEHHIKTTDGYPNMIVRFEIQGASPRDIRFVTPPAST